MRIVDLSLTIDNECMTCGTPWHEKVLIEKKGSISEVGRNTHKIIMGSHSGTHMDAPLHFISDADGIDKISLEKVCGRCSVIDLSYKNAGSVIGINDVQSIKITERMIFRFDWFKKWKTEYYYDNYPFFSIEAAEFLVNAGMKVIAIDTPSPDSFSAIKDKTDSPVHKLFLGNDITIIEYLTNTDQLDSDKNYFLIALPLKIKDCDGAPARVIVMEDEY